MQKMVTERQEWSEVRLTLALMLAAVSMFAVLMFGTWRMGIGEVVSPDERGRSEGRRRSISRWGSGVLGFCGWGVGEDMV